MGKFLGFLAGILATIIGGYIVWYLTRPISVEGMVLDRSTNLPVAKALVTVDIKSSSKNGPYDQPTDANGSYGMQLDGLSWRSTVLLHVAAAGFQKAGPDELVVTFGGNRKDMFLTPIASPPPGGTPAVFRPSVVQPPAYVRRAIMEKIQIKK